MVLTKQDITGLITAANDRSGGAFDGQIDSTVDQLYQYQCSKVSAKLERDKEEARHKTLPPPRGPLYHFVRGVMRLLMYPAMVIGGTGAYIVIYFTFWG